MRWWLALNNVSITSVFAQRPNGRYLGAVTGLKNGHYVLTAPIPRSGSQLRITTLVVDSMVSGWESNPQPAD
jgi:hypothetical protein